MTKKLEETFGLPSSNDPMLEELEKRYNFSENPDLPEVAQLALKAYKEMMLDISNFESKYRARNIEVAQTFLVLAKDALAKDEDLILKREKQDQINSKKEKPDEEEKPFDRDDFIKKLQSAGKQK